MDTLQIVEFDNLLENLSKFFSVVNKTTIRREDIFDALFLLLSDKEKMEWSGDLWDVKISELEAKALLKDFDFKTLDTVFEVDDGIFLKDLLGQKKVRIKDKGLIWVIHKNDKDPFPSCPHAHCLDQNLKLDLGNGHYYRNRNFKGRLKKKDFLDLRAKASFVYHGELPPLNYDKDN